MIGVGFVDVFFFLVLGIFFIVKEIDGYVFVLRIVDEIIIYLVEWYDFEFDLKNIREGVYNMIVYILEREYFKKR